MSKDQSYVSQRKQTGQTGGGRSVDRTIGGRILSIRQSKGLTVAEVSSLAGISVLLLREYEAGLKRIDPPACVRICDALHVNIPDLFQDFG